MGSEFKRLKRYHGAWTIIRAVTFAVSACLLLMGGLLLMQKLALVQMGAIWYIMSAVIAVAIGAAAFFMIRKSDLRLAEKIDSDQKMRERVQTMVAYRNEESPVLQLQREDTENRLKQVRIVGIRFYGICLHAVMFAAAFSVFMAGLLLPAKAVGDTPTNPPAPTEPFYEASAWQKAAMDELIAHVAESQMVQTVKEPLGTQLTELRQMMDTQVRVSQMRAKVIDTMTQAYTLTDEVNSNDDIYQVLNSMSHKIKAYLCYCLGNLLLTDYDEKMDTAEFLLQGPLRDYPEIGEIATQVTAVLKFSEFDANDPLYAAVEAFGKELTAAAQLKENSNLVDAKKMAGEAMYNLRTNAAAALNQQWLTKEEAMYVVKTLADIFAISNQEIPADPDREYDLDTSEPPPDVEGAPGTGEMKYPSDDKVYDYENNTHVPYPEILKQYLQDMTNDAMDGKFSDELEAFIRKYFGNLQRDDQEEN